MSKNKEEKKSVEKENIKTEKKIQEEKTVCAEENVKSDCADKISLSKDEFDKVKEHIDKLQKDKDDTVALAQRIQADFDNYRRRNASLQADSMEEGKRNVIKELLPILDNFDRAMLATDGVDDGWLCGIKLVQKQLLETLTKCGMSEIPADGKFDPELHNAVLQDEKEGAESGDIIEVLQKGYKVNDRIIRHSMVKVAK